MTYKLTAFARKNHLGFWVGWLRQDNGKEYPISNAKDREGIALNIAQRIADNHNEAVEKASVKR